MSSLRRWLVAASVCVALCPVAARAFPFAPLRMGGTPFEGPADGEATALWYNPAALGLLRNVRFTALGDARLVRGSIDRSPICAATGEPGACSGSSTSFPSQPIQRDTVTGFGAVAINVNDNVTLAVGVYTPWLSCPVSALCSTDSRPPGAYLGVSESFTSLYVSSAAALRLSSKLIIGGGISIVDSFARMSFDRDTAIDGGSSLTGSAGHESPMYAQRVSVRGDGGTWWLGMPKPSGVSTVLGVLGRPTDRLAIGISWQRVFAVSPVYTSSTPAAATVTPAPAQGDPCHGPCAGGDAILYALPDVWQAGARVQLSPTLELSTWGRLIMYGGYSRNDPAQLGLQVRLAGAPVAQARAPSQVTMDLGLIPEFAGEVGARWQARPSLRLGASLIMATSAVREALISPTALDGPKADVMLGATWQAARWLRFIAAYGLTWMKPVSTSGGQHPSATVACVDSGYSIDACGETLAGRGLPSNAGNYSLLAHHLTLGVELEIDYHR